MISSLLIANRGEIACRILRTARAMGIRTIAVYSDADRNALHVRMADESAAIGPAPAHESYLSADHILAAARAHGAEAIHPGYGFLSENAAFAQAVVDAGLVWVGPDAASIAAMGLKDAAKRRMQEAGVPVTPGYLGADQADARLHAEADRIGYPLLIKAVAGGGGKGMRDVHASADFADALQSCRREAEASFGDSRVLLEKLIPSPRHIEVQIFGDRHGNVVSLFERDCSLQRRHQKVIEEAPAPGMDAATRAAISAAAVRAARAVSYVGAGTIEFIADASDGLRADRIWFMEMNTRLQVEHPVTEAISGVDLVEWQLRVAAGEPLPLRQDQLAIDGWAMEARLYAEDPRSGFLPSTGRLLRFRLGDGPCRIDSGVEEGTAITPFYDPMIAKVIAHGKTREEARQALAAQLAGSIVWPLQSNAGFLVRALRHPDFVAGRHSTSLIADAGDHLLPPERPGADTLAAAAGRLALSGPLAGFRLNAPPRGDGRFLLDGKPIELPLATGRDAPATRSPAQPQLLPDVLLAEEGQAWLLQQWRADGGADDELPSGALPAPMTGRIVAVAVQAGEAVAAGQKLLTLEAMKMEYALSAPFAGTVTELNASPGALVERNALLVRITPADAA